MLRRLQQGDVLLMPHSRPMPVVGARCHELRLHDIDKTWRIIYRVDDDAIVIVEVFEKRTQTTPNAVIAACRKRLSLYDSVG